MRPSRLAPLALFAVVLGCSRKPPDVTPEGVVRELLERMERVDGDPAEARGAFELLSASTRANLGERARRAAAASGRQVGPEQMLAPARFSLRFQPHQMKAHADGDRAIVEVTGMDPEVDHAEVPCTLEDGRWRVEIALPALPPIERRPDGG